MADEIEHAIMKEIRPGRFVLIDGVPCRVVDIELSSPGKHGAAKVRLTAMTIFGNVKKTIVKPGDASVDVPIITKKKAQVVSLSGTGAQVMDSENFEVYEIPIPEELVASVTPGVTVEIIEVMSQRMISRLLNS
jgi:translation initiation factor 5A